jgi:hypothetical protein
VVHWGNLSRFSIVPFLFLAGCGDSSREPRGAAPPPSERQQGYGRSSPPSNGQRQAAFLNEIRRADPAYQTIDKALINENNEVALILNRSVEMDSVPALMRSIVTRMSKTFPGEDLTVIAYRRANPPIEIGTARFNARTRQITYSPARR